MQGMLARSRNGSMLYMMAKSRNGAMQSAMGRSRNEAKRDAIARSRNGGMQDVKVKKVKVFISSFSKTLVYTRLCITILCNSKYLAIQQKKK